MGWETEKNEGEGTEKNSPSFETNRKASRESPVEILATHSALSGKMKNPQLTLQRKMEVIVQLLPFVLQ